MRVAFWGYKERVGFRSSLLGSTTSGYRYRGTVVIYKKTFSNLAVNGIIMGVVSYNKRAHFYSVVQQITNFHDPTTIATKL